VGAFGPRVVSWCNSPPRPIAGIDIFHLTHEIEASDMTALEAVMAVDQERADLEHEADQLNTIISTEVRLRLGG
jgi:hypothetical protein